MSLNLKTILNSDDISTLIDKLNFNFNVLNSILSTKGPVGDEGVPGVPGLKGDKGDNGDVIYTGKNVVFTQHDPNWGVLYGSNAGILNSTNNSANKAIEVGYNVGDIFIDLSNNVFYDIVEDLTNPGNFIFHKHTLNYSLLMNSASGFVPDTQNNLNDDIFQGLRNNNKFATVSLTSFDATSILSGGYNSASYFDLVSAWGNYNKPILGFNRYNFKLSIDNVSGGGANSPLTKQNRVSIPSATSPYCFNQNYENFSPLIYLTSNQNNPHSSTGSVGVFLQRISQFLSKPFDIFYVVSESSNNGSFSIFDFKNFGILGNNLFLKPKSDSINNFNVFNFSVLDKLDNNSNTSKHLTLNFGMTVFDSNAYPIPSEEMHSDFDFKSGLTVNLFKDNSTNKKSNIVLSVFNGSSKEDVLTIHPNGSLSIGDVKTYYNPGSTFDLNKFQLNDNTRFLIRAKNDTYSYKVLSVSKTQTGSNLEEGFKLNFGILSNNKSVIYSNNVVFTGSIYNRTYNDLILQPNNLIDLPNITNPNNIFRVSIGETNPNTARFTVQGNVTIGGSNFTNSSNPTPDYSLRVDSLISVGIKNDFDSFSNLNNRYGQSVKLILSNQSTSNNTDGKVFQVFTGKLYNSKNKMGVIFSTLRDLRFPPVQNAPFYNFGLINEVDEVNSNVFLRLVRGQNSLSLDSNYFNGITLDYSGRVSIGGNTTISNTSSIYFKPDTNNYQRYYITSNPNPQIFSRGFLLELKKILSAETNETNPANNPNIIRPILKLTTDDVVRRLCVFPSMGSYTIYGPYDLNSVGTNTDKMTQFQPEIVFESRFKFFNVSPVFSLISNEGFEGSFKTTIKQGWCWGDKVFLTPNATGQGGYFAVFSHNPKNNRFDDDWEFLMVYTPTNSQNINAKYSLFRLTNYTTLPTLSRTDFTFDYLPYQDGTNSDFITPPSTVSLTSGVFNTTGSPPFYYNHPSKIAFKKINERFVIFSFRIGIQITSSMTTNISINRNEYTNLIRIKIPLTNVYNILPPVFATRIGKEFFRDKDTTTNNLYNPDRFTNHLDTTLNQNDIENYQDFLDGFWYPGVAYAGYNRISNTTQQLNQNNVTSGYFEPSPSFKDFGASIKRPLRPVPIPKAINLYTTTTNPLGNGTGGTISPSLGFSENYDCVWTLGFDGTTNLNLYISLFNYIPLYNHTSIFPNGAANTNSYRTIYFSGHAILDSFVFGNYPNSTGGGWNPPPDPSS